MKLLTRRAPLGCWRGLHIHYHPSESPHARRQRLNETPPKSALSRPAPSRTQLSPEARLLLANFQRGKQNPAAVLKERLHEGRLDLETAQVCISMYRVCSLMPLSRSERIAKAKSDFLGSTALDFLWKDQRRWQKLLSDGLLVFDSLCFCLAAEGNAKYILALLRLDNPIGGQEASPVRPGWRGIVLRAFVKAQLDTALGTSADATLEAFFETRDEILQLRRKVSEKRIDTTIDMYATTSIWPAINELASALQSGAWPGTRVSKYLKFKKIDGADTSGGSDVAYRTTALSLHIRSRPDHRPAFSHVKETFSELSKSDARARLPLTMADRSRFYFHFRRLEELLQDGQHKDLDWAIDLRRRLFTGQDLVAFRDAWRRFLLAFGLKDAKGDLETVVTWAPDCYWIRAREEELRRHSEMK